MRKEDRTLQPKVLPTVYRWFEKKEDPPTSPPLPPSTPPDRKSRLASRTRCAVKGRYPRASPGHFLSPVRPAPERPRAFMSEESSEMAGRAV